MSFRVYISHSVAPHELGAIYGMAELAAKKGMEPILPDRRWQPGPPPARIQQSLRGLDAFVAVATHSGQHLEWVNAELAAAMTLGLKPQNLVSMVDEGLLVPPAGEVVTINRSDFQTTMRQAVGILERLQMDQRQRNLLAGLLLGGLIAILLASRE